MKKIILKIFFVLLIFLTMSMLIVTFTEKGLQLVVALSQKAAPGKLSISSVKGRLIGPLQLNGLEYSAEGLEFALDAAAFDWKLSRLLSLQLHIIDLNASGIRITTGESEKTGQETEGLPEISLPVDIRIDNLLISSVSIMQQGSDSPFVINKIALKAQMDKDRLRIDSFNIVIPEADLTLKGDMMPKGSYPLNIRTDWNIHPEGFSAMEGTGSLSGDMNRLMIEQSVSAPVNALLHATVHELIKEPQWDMDLTLSNLSLDRINSTWPEVTVNAEVSSTGSVSAFDMALTADAAGKQIPQSSIQLKGKGTKSSVHVQSLTAKLMGGEMNASGSVTWAPSLSWKASLDAQSINPGTLWPVWQGALDMNVTAEGDMHGSSSRVFLERASVKGDLRGYPFRADTIFSMDSGAYHLTKLDLVSGSALLHASGEYSDAWDAQWDIAVPDLGELIPNGKGQIHGKGTIRGNTDLPTIAAEMNSSRISYETYQAGSLAINMRVDTTGLEHSIINASAENILINTQEIKNIVLKADGNAASHAISLSAETEKESVIIAADAGYEKDAWKGSLVQANLNLADFGVWKLKQSGIFAVSPQSADIRDLCWIQNSASFCIQALWTEKEGLNGNAGLSEIPLSLFKPTIPSAMSLEGSLGGDIDISYGNSKLYGKASIVLPSGSVSYAMDKGDSVTLTLGLTRLDTSLDHDGIDMAFELSLPERGQISSSIRLPGFSPLDMHMGKQEISGRVSADLNALDLLPLFTSVVEKPEGVFNSNLNITGTLADPEITGYVNLVKGQAGIPDLGLLMKDIQLKVTSDSSGIVDIDGKLSSGDGTAHVQGQLALKDPANIKADIRVKGEKLEALKIPEAWVVVSPDISIKLEKKDIHVEGEVIIPEALIEPPDLSNAVSVSQDVVIVSETSPVSKDDKWKIHSRMQLTLGDNVRFKGFGLSGRIAGGLKITEEPGKATKAQGEMQVLEGQYKAYGQELTIEKGQLLFAGLIDDPGLNVRAVRKIKEVSAGVQVIGTLKVPEMRIYSSPAMDQSDALSYLMFGRPMNSLSGSEGGQMHNAASSAYVSGGGLLAKKIGAAFGIRDVEIEKGETQQESALVIGKYLSPKLYVSYGIGLFEPVNTLRMRYTLSPIWQLQTEYGIESGGDVLYTIER